MIPSSWTLARLDSLGRWAGGGTPSKDVAAYWTGGTIPWVSPKDMKVFRLRDSEDHITPEAVVGSAASLVDAGSILVVTRSGILEHTFPVALTDREVTVNQDMKALTPHGGVRAAYAAWGLRRFGVDILNGCKKDGTTVASVEFAALRAFELPIAPLPEQERIVEAIEEQLSRLDAAVVSLERVQKKLKAYRASVLKAAVEGRLVPTEAEVARKEGRDYEPASVLLRRILADRRRRWEDTELARLTMAGKPPKDNAWKARYVEPAAPDTSRLPELPEGWCWASLEQLSGLIRNGQPMAPREPSGVRILRISAVRPLRLDLDDVRHLPGRPEDYAEDLIEAGDLLFTRYNGSTELVGVCALVGEVGQPTVHPDKLIKVRLIPGNVGGFVAAVACTGESRAFIRSRTRTTAGQAGISGGDLRAVPVPLAPLAEQRRIEEVVDATLSHAEVARESAHVELRRISRLRQSILKWAFEGKLVDQDPNDEPAEKLLARIRADRAATPSPKASPGRKAKK